MDIGNISRHKKNLDRDQKMGEFLRKDLEAEKRKMIAEEESLQPKEKPFPKNTLMHWQAPDYEPTFRRDDRWYKYISLVIAAIVGYAVYMNSPIMAITFILIGLVGYLYLKKEPEIWDFFITKKGVVAGKELYAFEDIDSFWIFYEPGETKVISLHNKKSMFPFVHIPVHDQDPVQIREILLKFIPEIEQEPSFIDTLEKFIGI